MHSTAHTKNIVANMSYLNICLAPAKKSSLFLFADLLGGKGGLFGKYTTTNNSRKVTIPNSIKTENQYIRSIKLLRKLLSEYQPINKNNRPKHPIENLLYYVRSTDKRLDKPKWNDIFPRPFKFVCNIHDALDCKELSLFFSGNRFFKGRGAGTIS